VQRWSIEAGDELVSALARERRSFEALLFRLLNARHLLDTASPRFLSWAAADLERAYERLREAELRRASVVAATGAQLGEGDLTLRALIDRAPEPYGGVLNDHRQAIGRLAAETAAAAEAANELAQRGRERLDVIPISEEEERDGDSVTAALDRELARCGYDAIVGVTSPLTLPSLTNFLA